MQLIPLKSPKIQVNQDLNLAILEVLKQVNQTLEEKDILVIASKVVAYSQGLLKHIHSEEDFRELVRQESDEVLDEGSMILTMKNHILIPNAGVDRSNVPEGQAVLWPKKPFEAAEELRRGLMNNFQLQHLGVVISDSTSQPLRAGTVGIAIGWAGFEGVRDERGNSDLFGRPMEHTKIALADSLSSAANLLMGETDASIPFVLIRGADLTFTNQPADESHYFFPPEKCLYSSIMKYK